MILSCSPFLSFSGCLRLEQQYQYERGGGDQREKEAAGHDTRGAIGASVKAVARAKGAERGTQRDNTQDDQQKRVENAHTEAAIENGIGNADSPEGEHGAEDSHSRDPDKQRVVIRAFEQARRDPDQQDQTGDISDDAAKRNKPYHDNFSPNLVYI